MLEGVLEKGQELRIHSLNDNKGILTADCIEEYEFKRGAEAVIRLSDKPLRVVSNIFTLK